LSGLGLDGIEGLGGGVAFATEEFDSLFHTHLLLDSPRRGVVNAIALRTGDVNPEPWVPPDVESYITLNWDLRRTYETTIRFYEMFRGGEGVWDLQVLKPTQDRMGLDLERDVIQALSGRATMITWMEKPARLNSQATLLGFKLRDTEATRKVVERLVTRFPDRLPRKAYAGVTYYAAPVPNRQANRREDVWRPDVACLAVMDDYLLLANSEKLLQAAILTQQDPSKKLANELDYKIIASRIKRQLGESQAGMITFSRPEEGMRQWYELASSEKMRAALKEQGQSNPFFKSVEGALGAHPLPPFSVIAQHLSPSGGLVTDDETGIHYMAFTLRRK
jgi:hypothetical protein